MAAHGTGRLPFGEHQITSVLSAVRPETGAWAMPICASTSFGFGDAQYAADMLSLQTRTYIRVGHPTSAGFEERLDSQEGGVGAANLMFGVDETGGLLVSGWLR